MRYSTSCQLAWTSDSVSRVGSAGCEIKVFHQRSAADDQKAVEIVSQSYRLRMSRTYREEVDTS